MELLLICYCFTYSVMFSCSYKWFVPFTYITSSSPDKIISKEINMTLGKWNHLVLEDTFLSAFPARASFKY